MKRVAESHKSVLNVEERNLLSVAYKKVSDGSVYVSLMSRDHGMHGPSCHECGITMVDAAVHVISL